jgi:hypothetical protein
MLLNGDVDAAIASMQAEGAELIRLTGLAAAYHTAGRMTEADAALDELIAKYESGNAYYIASVLAHRGEADRSFEWLNRAEQAGEPILVEVIGEPLFANLYDDPRWVPFLRKLGKAPEQLAEIKLELTLPDAKQRD